jgi:hypothetical protein
MRRFLLALSFLQPRLNPNSRGFSLLVWLCV